MRLTVFFSVVFLCAFFTAKGEVSLIPPKGWECLTDPEQLPQKILRIYIGTGKSQFSPSINIASEEATTSIEEYLRLAKSHHESQPNVKCALIGKTDSKAGPMHLLQIDTMTQWGNVRFIQAIMIKNSFAYVITATCLQEEFSHLSPQFFKAIQTFTIQ